jgi:hypothetical protein
MNQSSNVPHPDYRSLMVYVCSLELGRHAFYCSQEQLQQAEV